MHDERNTREDQRRREVTGGAGFRADEAKTEIVPIAATADTEPRRRTTLTMVTDDCDSETGQRDQQRRAGRPEVLDHLQHGERGGDQMQRRQGWCPRRSSRVHRATRPCRATRRRQSRTTTIYLR